jgi:copper chaperone
MDQAKSSDFIDVRHGVKRSNIRTRLILENIKCGGCAKTITSSMSDLGFTNCVVSTEECFVEFDNPSKESEISKAVSKLKELGYPLVDTEEGLKSILLKARSYVSCAIGKIHS